MMDRIQLLRDMGLYPLWVRRDQPARQPQETMPTRPDEAPTQGNPDLAQTPIDRLDWPALEQAIRTCTRCKLSATRTQAVPGVGDRQPEWFVVGEGPGEQEDLKGEPFVGPAGRLLDNMLAAIGKRRGEGVYITNVVKCRPPGNRNPEPDEITACRPFLERQLALARPKLVLAVGKFAAQTVLGREAPVSELRLQGGRCVLTEDVVPVAVTYHPSYLLRSPTEKAKAWDDLQRALALAESERSGSRAGVKPRD
ncbi:MAG: uracil-DNA glycosylase [Casimicrobiaceae bacterium]|nr:uracil-DNA glycosylase [Casimicrobiaceae bacterium]MCX8099534.1 uracil-DNA glycosylase [Casimicrobiaceae bacterium]MDW8311401.1 uracil-DNA glycosylase [Burkholderiales bacterium]